MRVPLPQLKANGHAPAPAQVFVVSGLCQAPSFGLRWRDGAPDDFCLIYMGAPGGVAAVENAGPDPYFVLRRSFEAGAAVVALRVEWEGIFTLLANDDEHAEAVYASTIVPAAPEDVQRQWSDDPSTLTMFQELLRLG